MSGLAQSFTVSEIYLENLQRVSSTTIFSVLNVNIGDEITQADIYLQKKKASLRILREIVKSLPFSLI